MSEILLEGCFFRAGLEGGVAGGVFGNAAVDLPLGRAPMLLGLDPMLLGLDPIDPMFDDPTDVDVGRVTLRGGWGASSVDPNDDMGLVKDDISSLSEEESTMG